jgi:hypothetical protein
MYIRKKPCGEEKPNISRDSAVLRSYNSLAAYNFNVPCNPYTSLQLTRAAVTVCLVHLSTLPQTFPSRALTLAKPTYKEPKSLHRHCRHSRVNKLRIRKVGL